MFDQVWTFLQDQLQNNNVFSGVALVGAMGGIIAGLRSYPARIYNWSVQRLFMEFEITIKDRAFEWVEEWLAAQPYTRNRARWLTVRTERKGRNDRPHIILSPAPGVHWLFWKGYFLIVNRDRKETTTTGGQTQTPVERETFIIKILTRNRDSVIHLLHEARDVATPPDEERVEVMTPEYGAWDDAVRRRPRPLESVILADGVAENLIGDVAKFRESHKWYTDRGIPYRRGYLLHGPPGSGKSSIVFAIASHLGLDICMLSLSDPNLNDKELRKLLSNVPQNSLVLIEDVDCDFHQREATEDKENKLTFSGLLNALDGVAASEGTILFMTSNFPERLDPALVRPGRCDMKVFIGYPELTQKERMFLRFYPDHAFLAKGFADVVTGDVSMAAIQGHFLKYRDCPHEALSHYQEIQ